MQKVSAAVLIFMVTLVLLAGHAPCAAFATQSPIYSFFGGARDRLPLETPATTNDPFAVWVNPAALATGKAGGFAYFHTFSDSTISGDDGLAISLGSMAFAAEFISAGLLTDRFETNRYTLASGQRLYKGIYLGSSYSWHSSELCGLDKTATWTVGALLRPHRKVSLGLVARDLNSPSYVGTKFRPIFETSVGVRPLSDRLTLFATYLARERELDVGSYPTQPQSFLSYGVEWQPADGIVLRAGGDEDENLSASLTLRMGVDGIGSVFTQVKGKNGETDKTQGTAYFTAGPYWHESVLMPVKGYLEIDLSGTIGESRPPFSLFGGGPRYTLRGLLDRIEYAKSARDVKAIVLKCGGVSANLAIYDELRQALIDFRKTGKKVIAYVESAGNGLYYLLSASDYIVLTPNGGIELTGFKSEALFLRGTLEKLGVKAHYARVGKYKSATEQLTEDRLSEPGREALNAVLDDRYDKFVDDIASGRGKTSDEVRDIIDRGPYLPVDAVREGLVDTLAYWDEVPDIVTTLTGKGIKGLPYGRFARRMPARTHWDEAPRIGIVYGVGGILSGSNRRDMLMGDIMGSETISEAFKQLRDDKSIKAVVFRVDSPGGEMTASDQIRRAVELTAREKPVIVSMGGVAGSGGYHVSCDGTMILADHSTITGSIGVLALWFHTRGLYEKIGINKDIFLRGEHADIMPSWRDVTDEDTELIQSIVDRFYDKFVADVAKGRGMGVDEVHAVAQGRIWSGKEAEEIGLVDKVGGLREAIRLAKREAGIPEGEAVDFTVLPAARGFFDNMMSSMAARVTGDIRIPGPLQDALEGAAYLETFDQPYLYLMPYRIEEE
ncbi:MAG: signal peptide peptidase SppA [Candidatus Eisenbacteria bacterium]